MYAKCNELATPKETRTLSFTAQQKAKVEEQSGTTATISFSNEWVWLAELLITFGKVLWKANL